MPSFFVLTLFSLIISGIHGDLFGLYDQFHAFKKGQEDYNLVVYAPYKIVNYQDPDVMEVFYELKDLYEERTCLKFVPHENELDFLTFSATKESLTPRPPLPSDEELNWINCAHCEGKGCKPFG